MEESNNKTIFNLDKPKAAKWYLLEVIISQEWSDNLNHKWIQHYDQLVLLVTKDLQVPDNLQLKIKLLQFNKTNKFSQSIHIQFTVKCKTSKLITSSNN